MGGVGKVYTAQTHSASLNTGICRQWIVINIHHSLVASGDLGSTRLAAISLISTTIRSPIRINMAHISIIIININNTTITRI